MFVIIKPSGATHIAIHIPHDGAEKTLPAIARMLEQNAVFIDVGYSETKLVKPEMHISLGDTFRCEGGYGNGEDLVVCESTAIISDDFVNATPQVLASHAAEIKRKTEENSKQRTELQYARDEIERLKAQIEELTNPEAA